ncbi:hypothetical protein WA026_018963, partial [Henosepilachna vigintioctopunctata]
MGLSEMPFMSSSSKSAATPSSDPNHPFWTSWDSYISFDSIIAIVVYIRQFVQLFRSAKAKLVNEKFSSMALLCATSYGRLLY